MIDFTLKTYTRLLSSLQNAGFFFQTFSEYLQHPKSRSIILRHDVDRLPTNSLKFAHILAKNNMKGTFYFRIIPKSYNESIIKKISYMDHEIGYHYETMDTCRGDIDEAYNEFCIHLHKFQKITKIRTICMHGSPLSKYDNRAIWSKYNYKKLGIIGEPYFDVDFNEVFYITDTARRWNGDRFNVRDKPMEKVESKEILEKIANIRRSGKVAREKKDQDIVEQLSIIHNQIPIRQWPIYKTTNDIIKAIQGGTFPHNAMLTFHPQRWHNKPLPWMKELVSQNIKNQGKRLLIALRKS